MAENVVDDAPPEPVPDAVEPAPEPMPAPQAAEPPAPEPEPAAPKRRGRPPGSKNKPKPPKTVPAEEVAAPAPLERRNEPQMLRQFSRMYPSYNLNPLLRRRHQQLVEAQAFNEWLSNRRLRQEGESYADELGRMTEAVNRRIPQLRYAPAERQGVRRMARDVAAGRNSSDSQVFGGLL